MSDREIQKLIKDTLAEVPGVSGHAKMPRISRVGNSLVIDVYLRVVFGEKIPTLAWDVQQKLKKRLEGELDEPLKAININVQGVDENKR